MIPSQTDVAPADSDALAAAQADVFRSLGRWLIRFQALETRMKRLAAEASLEGTPGEFMEAQNAALAGVEKLSAGQVKKDLYTRRIVADGAVGNDADAPPKGHEGAWLRVTRTVVLERETHDEWQQELAALVDDRNALVHHFDQLFDLDTLESCQRVLAHLAGMHTRVEAHHARYGSITTAIATALPDVEAMMSSEEYRRMVNDGIAPDGSIIWGLTPIVHALHEASDHLGQGDWISIEDAGRWMESTYPTLTPAGVYCTSWPEVIQRAGQFETRCIQVNGKSLDQYRALSDLDRSVEIEISS